MHRIMRHAPLLSTWFALLSSLAMFGDASAQDIPRPEHPRPDAVRNHWNNLNGSWSFRFDPQNQGLQQRWYQPGTPGFELKIQVPFCWESPLSGIKRPDYIGVAWYTRTFEVPATFPKDQRVWLHFEAVDESATVWVNGRQVARHDGGYSPFSADITEALDPAGPQVVTVRVDDPTTPEHPTGKQVGWYTRTSGIWQTVWLEARPPSAISSWTIRTTIKPAAAEIRVTRAGDTTRRATLTALVDDPGAKRFTATFEEGKDVVTFSIPIEQPRLWSPDSPQLYDLILELDSGGGAKDVVGTYFGLRTIARGKIGDEPHERILLNEQPIYLRGALDQSFNPQGIYTAPSDEFLREDMASARKLGLNMLRIHIKPDEPRRLYWADKLGVLILEDMPNTWRQTPQARRTWEQTMREVVQRDHNHPAIITWVAFNETWGLGRPEEYKADRDTQDWVSRMVSEIRRLDPTRLVEDNSPCNYDHIPNTDLNSWHFYIDDPAAARRHIEEVVNQTSPGSGFNYCPGLKQGTAPLINSEYGGVSAGGGDRDVSWCFRDLTTQLRRHPKIQGYVYTELADIEWEHNGFLNYDRTPKQFGYDAFAAGMTVADLQGADFIGYDAPPAIVARPGETLKLPVFVSHYSHRTGRPSLRWSLVRLVGEPREGAQPVPGFGATIPVAWKPYTVVNLSPLELKLPSQRLIGALTLELLDAEGRRVAANYVNLVVRPDGDQPRIERDPGDDRAVIVRFAPNDYARKRWSGATTAPEGKVAGQGHGVFEYHLKLPEEVLGARPSRITLEFEAAARAGRAKVDWPLRINAQDFPQTDSRSFATRLQVSIDNQLIANQVIDDEPADSRGVLSHLAGVEHGGYGRKLVIPFDVTDAMRQSWSSGQPLVLRFAVAEQAEVPGGFTLFGAKLGALSEDPLLRIVTSQPLPPRLGASPTASLAVDRATSRRQVLLATGEQVADKSDLKATNWAFTTIDPGLTWNQPGHADSTWRRGRGGFGTAGTPGLRVNTRWDTPTIWLRAEVDLPAFQADDSLILRLFHDENVEIFVNGEQIFQARGYVTAYQDHVLNEQQRSRFRVGKNVLAVRCRQTGGGQGIDLGLVLEP